MSIWRAPRTKPEQRALVAALIKMQRHALDAGDDRRSFEHVLDGLALLHDELRNRTPMQRGRPTSDTVTPAKRAEVIAMKRDQPRIAHQEIAHRLNLNIGRVSEILHGKRGA